MNSLEWIDAEITKWQEKLDKFKKQLIEIKGTRNEQTTLNCIEAIKLKLQYLQQIKAELEVMGLIKNGWSSMSTTSNGEHIMRFQNLTLDDWIKLWNKLEEILLKKALEVNKK